MGWPLAREALLSGWRLIRRAALALLAWWLLRVVEQESYLKITGTSDGPPFLLLVGVFVTLVFEAFLISAVFRAYLRPEKPGLAWLRFGWVEAKMFGLLTVTGLIALLIATPVSIAMSYGFLFMRWPGLGLVVESIGTVAAVLVLLRFCALPAILVDAGRVDLRTAWNATRGRYWILLLFVVLLGLIERGLAAAWDLAVRAPLRPAATPAHLESDVIYLSRLPTPLLLLQVAGEGLLALVFLIFVSAAVVAVWRASKQTLD